MIKQGMSRAVKPVKAAEPAYRGKETISIFKHHINVIMEKRRRPAGMILRPPDMPKCTINMPLSVSSNRYFARRFTAVIRAPEALDLTVRVRGQRSRDSRTTTFCTFRPRTWGEMPLRVVSTSGFRHARRIKAYVLGILPRVDRSLHS